MKDSLKVEETVEEQRGAAMRLIETVLNAGQLLLIGLLLQLLLFEGTEVYWLLRLGVIATLLAAVVKSQGWFVLLALQASLFLREPRRPDVVLGLVPLLFCVTVLAIMAYTYLGRSFRSRISVWIVEQVRGAVGLQGSQQSRPNQVAAAATWVRFSVTQLLSWLVVVVVAMMALRRLPISNSMRVEWLKSSMANEAEFWPGASLLVVAVLLVVVLTELGWRQMTAAQARIYMRSSFMLYHYRDLRMVVFRRLKMQRSAASNAANSAANSAAKKRLAERAMDAAPGPN